MVDLELKKLYLKISKLRNESKFKEIDNIIFSYINEYTINLFLIGLLRLTFLYRNELVSWNILLSYTQERFDRTNLNTKQLLRGLL